MSTEEDSTASPSLSAGTNDAMEEAEKKDGLPTLRFVLVLFSCCQRLISYCSSLGLDLVTIEVGKEEGKKKFVVHKDLLCASSPFFKNAFEGVWKEAQDGVIPLPDATVEVFTAFIEWLYFRRTANLHTFSAFVCLNCGEKCRHPLNEATKKELGWKPASNNDKRALDEILGKADSVILLYHFADQYGVPQLREQIVNHAWSMVQRDEGPHVQEVLLATQLLPETSSMYLLLIDAFGEYFAKDSLICIYDSLICQRLPSSVWFKFFMLSLNSSRDRRRPKLRRLCHYHEHSKGPAAVDACRGELNKRKRYIKEQKESVEAMVKSKESKKRKHAAI